MAKEDIGHIDCPACGEPAKVREQKNRRTYILCNSPVCGFQGFARSAEADGHLRRKMRPATAAPAHAPATQPEKKGSWLDEL